MALKTKLTLNKAGFTLTEMMIAVAILGIIGSMAAGYLTQVVRFWKINQARVEIQRDARSVLALINRQLRQGKKSTIRINQLSSSQPPHSKITFNDADDKTYSFFQENNQLKWAVGSSTKVLSENLRYLAFTMTRTDDFSIVSMASTFEKATFDEKTKALQLSVEKVRVMNE